MRSTRARFLLASIVICSLCCIHTSRAQSYGEKLDGHWRTILGLHNDDGAYRWLSYPTGNFGVMTLYRAAPHRQMTDADRICATWTCLGIDPAKIPLDESPFTTVNGFANVSLRSSFELANNQAGRAAINLFLSNLFRSLSVDGAVNVSKPVTFDLRAGEVYQRTLNLPKFQAFLESSPDPLIQNSQDGGELTYIGSDIVARGLELTIDTENDPLLAAHLTQAIAKLGRDDPSGISISLLWRETYVVQFPEFVVLATQLRHQLAFHPHRAHRLDSATRQTQFKASASSAPMPNVDPKTLRVIAGE